MKAPKLLHTDFNVAGVTQDGRQSAVSRLNVGNTVWLEREPNNFFDRNAIAVFSDTGAWRGRQKIGYVPRSLARSLAELIDEGAELGAMVSRCGPFTNDEGQRLFFCEVEVIQLRLSATQQRQQDEADAVVASKEQAKAERLRIAKEKKAARSAAAEQKRKERDLRAAEKRSVKRMQRTRTPQTSEVNDTASVVQSQESAGRRAYWEALTGVLYDLEVDANEQLMLRHVQRGFGVTDDEVCALHARALASVLRRFAEDGRVNQEERDKLRRLMKCLQRLGWMPGEAHAQFGMQ